MNQDTIWPQPGQLWQIGRRGLIIAATAILGLLVLVLSMVSLVLLPVWLGLGCRPLPWLAARSLAESERVRAWAWSGVPIPQSNRPEPAPAGGRRERSFAARSILADPATWRALAWLIANIPVGLVLGTLAAGLVLVGLLGVLVAPWLWALTPGHAGVWGASFPLGVAFLALAPVVGPHLENAHARFSRRLLARDHSATAARQTLRPTRPA